MVELTTYPSLVKTIEAQSAPDLVGLLQRNAEKAHDIPLLINNLQKDFANSPGASINFVTNLLTDIYNDPGGVEDALLELRANLHAVVTEKVFAHLLGRYEYDLAVLQELSTGRYRSRSLGKFMDEISHSAATDPKMPAFDRRRNELYCNFDTEHMIARMQGDKRTFVFLSPHPEVDYEQGVTSETIHKQGYFGADTVFFLDAKDKSEEMHSVEGHIAVGNEHVDQRWFRKVTKSDWHGLIRDLARLDPHNSYLMELASQVAPPTDLQIIQCSGGFNDKQLQLIQTFVGEKRQIIERNGLAVRQYADLVLSPFIETNAVPAVAQACLETLKPEFDSKTVDSKLEHLLDILKEGQICLKLFTRDTTGLDLFDNETRHLIGNLTLAQYFNQPEPSKALLRNLYPLLACGMASVDVYGQLSTLQEMSTIWGSSPLSNAHSVLLTAERPHKSTPCERCGGCWAIDLANPATFETQCPHCKLDIKKCG